MGLEPTIFGYHTIWPEADALSIRPQGQPERKWEIFPIYSFAGSKPQTVLVPQSVVGNNTKWRQF